MKTLRLCKITALLIAIGLLAGCATIDFEQPKVYSTSITDAIDTALGKYAAYETAHHDGQSAFYPLNKGMDALGIRTCSIF